VGGGGRTFWWFVLEDTPGWRPGSVFFSLSLLSHADPLSLCLAADSCMCVLSASSCSSRSLSASDRWLVMTKRLELSSDFQAQLQRKQLLEQMEQAGTSKRAGWWWRGAVCCGTPQMRSCFPFFLWLLFRLAHSRRPCYLCLYLSARAPLCVPGGGTFFWAHAIVPAPRAGMSFDQFDRSTRHAFAMMRKEVKD